MQRKGGVEVGLGGLHLHRDCDCLDDFGGGVADDVAAEHAVGGAVDHELHQHAGVAAGHRRLDRAEIGLVDVDMAHLRARLCFGQADGADFGL